MATEYSVVLFSVLEKRVPTCPACTHREKDQQQWRKAQPFPDPFAPRYWVAKMYTSAESFLLASGFSVRVFWNSPISLFCSRWL